MTTRSFEVRQWNLATTPRIVLDVRDLETLSIDAVEDNGSGNAWSTAVNVKWGHVPDEGSPHNFGSAIQITTATPFISEQDVSYVAYVYLERSANVTAEQLVWIKATGKVKSGLTL